MENKLTLYDIAMNHRKRIHDSAKELHGLSLDESLKLLREYELSGYENIINMAFYIVCEKDFTEEVFLRNTDIYVLCGKNTKDRVSLIEYLAGKFSLEFILIHPEFDWEGENSQVTQRSSVELINNNPTFPWKYYRHPEKFSLDFIFSHPHDKWDENKELSSHPSVTEEIKKQHPEIKWNNRPDSRIKMSFDMRNVQK